MINKKIHFYFFKIHDNFPCAKNNRHVFPKISYVTSNIFKIVNCYLANKLELFCNKRVFLRLIRSRE